MIFIDKTGTEVMEVNRTLMPSREKRPKILIIGTLGAGKTTFAEYVSKKMRIPYIGIDDCRRQVGDGTFEGEYKAWARFIDVCSAPEASILEFSGGGPDACAVQDALLESGMPVYIIWLDLALDICIQRASGRRQDVPAPYIWGEISKSTPQIRKGVEQAWIKGWGTTSEIHLLHLEMLSEMTVDEQFDALMNFMAEDGASIDSC